MPLVSPLLQPLSSSQPSPASSHSRQHHRVLRIAAALALVLLTIAGFYYLVLMTARGPPPTIVFSRISLLRPSCSNVHRLLRGGRGGLYPVTSPTNGGQIVSAGVPWAPYSIAEAQAKSPSNAIRTAENGLVGVRACVSF